VLVGLELSERKLLQVLEPRLHGLVVLFIDVVDDVELTRTWLEHLAVTGAEPQDVFFLVKEPIQIFKLDQIHCLELSSKILKIFLRVQ